MIIESKQLAKPPEIVGKLEDKDVYEYVTKGGYYVVVAKGDKCEPETLGVGPHRLIARSVAKKKLKEMKKEISFSDLHKSEELPESVLQKYLPDWENVLEILQKTKYFYGNDDFTYYLNEFVRNPSSETLHHVLDINRNPDQEESLIAAISQFPSPSLYNDIFYNSYYGRGYEYAKYVYKNVPTEQLIRHDGLYKTEQKDLESLASLEVANYNYEQRMKKYQKVVNAIEGTRGANNETYEKTKKISYYILPKEIKEQDLEHIRLLDLALIRNYRSGSSFDFVQKVKNKFTEKAIKSNSLSSVLESYNVLDHLSYEDENTIKSIVEKTHVNQVLNEINNENFNKGRHPFINELLMSKIPKISIFDYLNDPQKYGENTSRFVFGNVNVPVIQNGNSHKLRIARDTILASGKQELHPKLLPPGNWAEFRLPNGNISADLIQKKIDSSRVPYEYRFSTWSGAQRHSDQDSNVLQIHATPEMIKQIEDAGLRQIFDSFYNASERSGHPVSNNTSIGWVRWTGNQKGIQIDEIQTDISPKHFDKEKDAEKIEKTKQLQKILFQGKHPSELMHEAFLQVLRDGGWHDTPVHIHDVGAKVNLSGLDKDKEPPAHFKEGYRDIPKKMGYQPAQYGTLETQQNPSDEMQQADKAQHAEKIRKFEYLDILKPFMKAQK